MRNSNADMSERQGYIENGRCRRSSVNRIQLEEFTEFCRRLSADLRAANHLLKIQLCVQFPKYILDTQFLLDLK
jgi:hypothetical protein